MRIEPAMRFVSRGILLLPAQSGCASSSSRRSRPPRSWSTGGERRHAGPGAAAQPALAVGCRALGDETQRGRTPRLTTPTRQLNTASCLQACLHGRLPGVPGSGPRPAGGSPCRFDDDRWSAGANLLPGKQWNVNGVTAVAAVKLSCESCTHCFVSQPPISFVHGLRYITWTLYRERSESLLAHGAQFIELA